MRFAAGLLLVLLAAGCGTTSKPSTSRADSLGTPLNASAKEVWEDYGSDEAAAETKYRGKTIQVPARLDPPHARIERIIDQDCLILPHQGIANGPPCYLCYLSPAGARAAPAKKPGESFYVQGICDRITRRPEYEQGYALVLKDCEISNTSKRPTE